MKKRISSLIVAAVCMLSAGCSDTLVSESAFTSEAISAEQSSEVTSSETTTTAATTTTSTTVVTTTTIDIPVTEEASQPAITRIELSGSASDIFTTEEICYAESDRVVMYFDKGVTVRGDMLLTTEKIMDELTAITGMSFERTADSFEYVPSFDMHYEDTEQFSGINDGSRIDIMIYDFGMYSQWAFSGAAGLDPTDYDYSYNYYQTIYHELSHVLQFMNGRSLCRTIDEGYASYTADKALRAAGIPAWVSIQYYAPYAYDDSVVLLGESGFSAEYDNNNDCYQYGIRLISFLTDTYGNDIYAKLLAEAKSQNFSSGFISDDWAAETLQHSEQLKNILASVTGDEDVLDKFAEWYRTDWDDEVESYMQYMESLGLEVR